ncbi:hypothetical protein [Pseudomonas moorei]|uniref:hypothetical protein n=1 Tax=Pseudomonas moorei TaxID=395599 RepID=UPI001FF60E71|nr:hypothetical protein [Pseudomonas moorei]
MLTFLAGAAHAADTPMSDAVVQKLLEGGKWSNTADDNLDGEVISADLVKELVLTYRANPNDRSAQVGLGLLALTLGVAEWGVSKGEDELPEDPAGTNWKSDTGPDSGKHLMSYGIGGVGVCHADVSDLFDFIRFTAKLDVVPQEHKEALLRLASPSIYSTKTGSYDQLRAAGLCGAPHYDSDLKGEPFKFFKGTLQQSYCKTHANPKLSSADWRTFATWTRAALRTKEGQAWMLRMWIAKYWDKTLARVPPGEGFPEEALINVRIRNSLPKCANDALTKPASGAHERIQREMDAYKKCKPDAYKRRCGLMLRPVVLYRHFAGEPPLTGIECPTKG